MKGGYRATGNRRASGNCIEDNFDDHWIENENGCWIWQRASDQDGYGLFHVTGGKQVRAHRWAHERKHGKLSKGLMIRHKCDTPGCVNPDHLESGTALDNAMDMINRGRHADTNGEKNSQTILAEIQVIEIRYLAAAGSPHKSIAAHYGITESNVSAIHRRKSWAHLPG